MVDNGFPDKVYMVIAQINNIIDDVEITADRDELSDRLHDDDATGTVEGSTVAINGFSPKTRRLQT